MDSDDLFFIFLHQQSPTRTSTVRKQYMFCGLTVDKWTFIFLFFFFNILAQNIILRVGGLVHLIDMKVHSAEDKHDQYSVQAHLVLWFSHSNSLE